jgi:hypothetical protein
MAHVFRPTLAEETVMSGHTITVGMDGDVDLAHFSLVVRHFADLVAALTSEVAGETEIEWLVDELGAGSALVTLAGRCAEMDKVERVVSAFALVGRALERGEPVPYSDRVQRSAREITGVLNGAITAVEFATDLESA